MKVYASLPTHQTLIYQNQKFGKKPSKGWKTEEEKGML